MAKFEDLQASVTQLTDAVSQSVTVESSAVALINGITDTVGAAVTKALEKDDAADSGSIQAAMDAIKAVKDQLTASSNALGAAVTANTPQAETPTDGGTGETGTGTGETDTTEQQQ